MQSLEKYKMESSDLGATWAICLSTHVDSKTQLTPKSNNVNRQKLTHSAWAYFVSYEIWRGIKCTPATLAEAFLVTFVFTLIYAFHFLTALSEVPSQGWIYALNGAIKGLSLLCQ